jgi:hypothetical protein
MTQSGVHNWRSGTIQKKERPRPKSSMKKSIDNDGGINTGKNKCPKALPKAPKNGLVAVSSGYHNYSEYNYGESDVNLGE